MNETHATKYLLGLQIGAPNGTAERERRILTALGKPHKHLFLIKILGEAGKSSASSLVDSLFISGKIAAASVTLTPKSEPRLAIRIGNTPPTHEEFATAVTLAWNAAREVQIEAPSYEEILLAAALALAREKGCRVFTVQLCAAHPVSAAQALASPRLCLLTSTSIQKAEALLPLADTAIDLVSAPQEPAVYRILTERAATTHCRLSFPTKNMIGKTAFHGGSQTFGYRDKDYTLPTLAHYQKSNAIAVIEAYHALVRQGFRLTEQNLLDALADPPPALCFRLFSLSPAWLLDTADSEFRLLALADAISKLPTLFQQPLTIWTEPHLKSACLDAFGERVAHLEAFERTSLRHALKKTKPPKDAPLLIVGTEAFTAEAYRALSDPFLL